MRIFVLNKSIMKKFSLYISFLFVSSLVYSQNVFFDYGEFLVSENTATSQLKTNITHYSNGNMKQVYHLLDGREHGEVVFYFENGLIKEKGNYNYGVKNGKWVSWNEDGNKIGEVSYDAKGLKDGKWKVWDNNGTVRAQMNYENGNRVGKWKIWDSNGNLINEKSY